MMFLLWLIFTVDGLVTKVFEVTISIFARSNFNFSLAGSTTYALRMQCICGWAVQRMYHKQFCIIALLSLYSVVSHVFPEVASFSNTVNTMNGDRETELCPIRTVKCHLSR